MKKRSFNLTMYIGFAAIGVFAFLLWSYLNSQAPKTITAMVPQPAGSGLQAYRAVEPADLAPQQIPTDTALADKIVTKEYYDQQTQGGKHLYTVTNLLPGQLIDRQALQSDAAASYQIVLPAERVVGVTTDLSGSLAGTLRSGDVVTAIAEGSGGLGGGQTSASFAKVISIGIGANAGRGVAGTTSPIGGGGDSGTQILLAVKKGDAPAIAGKSVRIVLNPFCAVVGATPRGADVDTAGKAVGQIVPLKGRETGCKTESADATTATP